MAHRASGPRESLPPRIRGQERDRAKEVAAAEYPEGARAHTGRGVAASSDDL